MATLAVKRKETTPPDGYVCHKCNETGHWIQQCPLKDDTGNANAAKRRRKASDHVPVQGVDPSQSDIDAARQMQRIPPPNCFCGMPSRLKKVKRSHAPGGESSRALGKYFFFCAKPRGDDTACRFARPVEDEVMDKKDRVCTFWSRNGSCKKGDKCMFSHDGPPGSHKKASRTAKNSEKKECTSSTCSAPSPPDDDKGAKKASTGADESEREAGEHGDDGSSSGDDDCETSSSSSSSSDGSSSLPSSSSDGSSSDSSSTSSSSDDSSSSSDSDSDDDVNSDDDDDDDDSSSSSS